MKGKFKTVMVIIPMI